MPTDLPKSNYSPTTKTLHWLTALLIITAFALGIIANGAAFGTGDEIAQKAWLFSLHKTVGVAAFFTALIRIIWALSQTKPADLHPDRKLETYVAHLVHWMLYISMLMVPLTGWLHHAASVGFAPILWPFGQSLPFWPKSETLSGLFSGGHFVFTKILLASIALHIAGALKHSIIDRDQTLRRMLPGRVDAVVKTSPTSRKPMITAFVIYAVAIGAGSVFWSTKPAQNSAAQLTKVSSQWQVSEGKIAISVNQFGTDIGGHFADWTAAINYDPASQTGAVEVTINIASLSLGSLSAQALGFDFLDAEKYPTAIFKAEIKAENAQHLAIGSLTLKGKKLPISLPFSLDIKQAQAVMSAELFLNRLDYSIGDNMPDEESLKFPVAVKINLIANRSP